MRELLFGVLVLVLVASGCSDDDDGATSDETTSTTIQVEDEQSAPTTTTADPSTAPSVLTLDQIETTLAAEWPDSISAATWSADLGPGWSCRVETAGDEIAAGSVASCLPDPLPQDMQHPVLTVLVLDDEGTLVVSEAGAVNYPFLVADGIVREVGAGLNCTRLLDQGSAFTAAAARDGLSTAHTYVAVVLYWFMEGRPSPLMDIDENGIPCETKFAPETVAEVWSGGWYPAEPPPGQAPAPVCPGDPVPTDVGVARTTQGDLDGDGRPDTVTAYAVDAPESLDDLRSWTLHVDFADSGSASMPLGDIGAGVRVGTTDIDSDGRSEVLVTLNLHQNATSEDVGVLHLDGCELTPVSADGTSATFVVGGTAAGAFGAACHDTDGDGSQDSLVVYDASDTGDGVTHTVSETTLLLENGEFTQTDARTYDVELVTIDLPLAAVDCPGSPWPVQVPP